MEVRASGPKLTLFLAPALNDSDEQRILTHSLQDYRIAEESLLIAAGAPDISLLTHDNGAKLRAIRRGLRVTPVPDGWLLELEKSDVEKRLVALERAVRERAAPLLSLEFCMPEDADLQFERIIYSDLSSELIDALCLYFTQSEMADAERDVDRLTRGFDSALALFRPEDHLETVRAWRDDVRAWLKAFPDHCHMASRMRPFTLKIANSGGDPQNTSVS